MKICLWWLFSAMFATRRWDRWGPLCAAPFVSSPLLSLSRPHAADDETTTTTTAPTTTHKSEHQPPPVLLFSLLDLQLHTKLMTEYGKHASATMMLHELDNHACGHTVIAVQGQRQKGSETKNGPMMMPKKLAVVPRCVYWALSELAGTLS